MRPTPGLQELQAPPGLCVKTLRAPLPSSASSPWLSLTCWAPRRGRHCQDTTSLYSHTSKNSPVPVTLTDVWEPHNLWGSSSCLSHQGAWQLSFVERLGEWMNVRTGDWHPYVLICLSTRIYTSMCVESWACHVPSPEC